VELLGKSAEELRTFLASLGEPAYRGGQIYHALYAERRLDLAAMTNLPAALREWMVPGGRVGLPTPAFSGPRSTGELPRHRGSQRFYGCGAGVSIEQSVQ